MALTPVYTQETRATLSGTITDPSGSAVGAAHVESTNVETANRSTAETNQLGQYRFLFLNPGTYRLTTEMAGFRTQIREASCSRRARQPRWMSHCNSGRRRRASR